MFESDFRFTWMYMCRAVSHVTNDTCIYNDEPRKTPHNILGHSRNLSYKYCIN